MSSKYKITDHQAPHFITFAVVEWVDVFSRKAYKDIFIESLTYCQIHKGLQLYAYCIMTNHVHLIASAKMGYYLTAILRDLKKFTANAIYKAISSNKQERRRNWMLWIFQQQGKRRNQTFQFWRHDNRPINLMTNEMKRQRLCYVHQNPVVAGLCMEPEHYPYSSARNYAGEQGLLEVSFMG